MNIFQSLIIECNKLLIITYRYREAGKQVADVLQTFTPLLERASVDEAYLDITDNVIININLNNYFGITLQIFLKIKKWLSNEKGKVTEKHLFNTFAVGYETIQDFLENIYTEDETLTNEQSLKLAIGASIANDIRLAVLQKTGVFISLFYCYCNLQYE